MKKYLSLFMLASCFALNSGFAQECGGSVESEAPKSDEVSVAEDTDMNAENPSLYDAEGDCGCNKGKKK